MGKLSAALNAIFSTSGDAGLTSSMKVPYFKSKTIDGNTAFYPDGMASMSALASVLGEVTTNLSNSDSLDNITAPGKYVYKSINPSMTGVPSDITSPFFMFVNYYTSGNSVVALQILVTLSFCDIYIRNYSAAQSRWVVWKKFVGVSIT